MWKYDLRNMGLSLEINCYNFLQLYSNNELTNAETIRRVRQKIQEENPELRGTVNEARQEQGKQVRREI
jgi:hypothetical protein